MDAGDARTVMAKGKVFQSANLNRVVDYNNETNTLVLEFVNGMHYSYEAVPFSVYFGLTRSMSPGQYFKDNIRGAYQYVRLS